MVNPALAIGQEDRFFNRLEDDVTRIIQREKRREQFATCQGQEGSNSTDEPVSGQLQMHMNRCIYFSYVLLLFFQDPRAEQLKYELEKKDEEIDKLKKTIAQWEASTYFLCLLW